MDDAVAAVPGLLTILVVVVAMPVTWYVTWLLWRLSHTDPEGAALRVAAVLKICVSITVTVFALVFINNGMTPPPLNLWQTMILTRGTLLILSVVPATYWLRWYRRRNGNGS